MAKNRDNGDRCYDKVLLNEIIYNASDSIFVIDGEGNILVANHIACQNLNISPEELRGANCRDLIKKGYYDRSTSLEAVDSKQTVIGIVRSCHGTEVISTSTPVFDTTGNITMVVTNSQNKKFMKNFLAELKQEQSKNEGDKNRVNTVIAESQLMRNVLLKANVVAPSDSSVMIYGESGTGKEVVANYIHNKSNRNNAPFIEVNCATIPDNLVESELFGYEKGAFTGAGNKGKSGLFEIADKGTLFLDEVGEMSLSIQPKVLRFLESGELRRVGGTAVKRVDVRVIGATNQNLRDMILEKKFREDLYYRLNVFPIKIAPLRDRPADILALAKMFLEEFNKKFNCRKVFTQDTLDSFVNYAWPGNVRELRNVVERLTLISIDEQIDGGIFYETDVPADIDSIANVSTTKTLREATEAFQEQYIKRVLKQCNNSISETSEKLGIHRSGLYKKLHKNKADLVSKSSKS